MVKLLLISNSTNQGEDYLTYCLPYISDFLGSLSCNILFIPYAAVTQSFDKYEQLVASKFKELRHEIKSIHHYNAPVKALEEADVIVVGGGNTFHLLSLLQERKLLEPIRKAVRDGIPYIGWSAGANLACPTIRTTNDMPIVEPVDLNALNLVPFQINPHYLDSNPSDFAGETREMRLEEFIEVNPDVYAVGLREGSILSIRGNKIQLIGDRKIRVFSKGSLPHEYGPKDNLDFLFR